MFTFFKPCCLSKHIPRTPLTGALLIAASLSADRWTERCSMQLCGDRYSSCGDLKACKMNARRDVLIDSVSVFSLEVLILVRIDSVLLRLVSRVSNDCGLLLRQVHLMTLSWAWPGNQIEAITISSCINRPPEKGSFPI